ncbi:hypothetical protein SCA6_000593 [Theobroma cacao]
MLPTQGTISVIPMKRLCTEKKCNRPPFTEVRKAKNIGIKAFQVIEMYYQSLKKVQYLRNMMKAGYHVQYILLLVFH